MSDEEQLECRRRNFAEAAALAEQAQREGQTPEEQKAIFHRLMTERRERYAARSTVSDLPLATDSATESLAAPLKTPARLKNEEGHVRMAAARLRLKYGILDTSKERQ